VAIIVEIPAWEDGCDFGTLDMEVFKTQEAARLAGLEFSAGGIIITNVDTRAPGLDEDSRYSLVWGLRTLRGIVADVRAPLMFGFGSMTVELMGYDNDTIEESRVVCSRAPKADWMGVVLRGVRVETDVIMGRYEPFNPVEGYLYECEDSGFATNSAQFRTDSCEQFTEMGLSCEDLSHMAVLSNWDRGFGRDLTVEILHSLLKESAEPGW
jgi:hypothetical protein